MTMYLDLSYSSNYAVAGTTIHFTSDGCSLLDGYYPSEGNLDEIPVIDQFDIWLDGTNDENRAKLAEIRQALEMASKFKDIEERKVLLRFRFESADDVYQSRILSGRVIHNSAMHHHYNRNRMRCTVIIERDPWWEKYNEAYVPLTNGNGTDITGGSFIRVYNCGDNASVDTSYDRDNWVTIDGVNDLEGDMPAPVKIIYYNLADLDIHIRTIMMFNNVYANPAHFDPIIEAEEYGTDTTLTGASAGYVGQFSIANDSEVMWWTLDVDSQVRYASGENFVAVMRFKYDSITNLSNLKFKVELYEATQGTIYLSDYFYPVGNATGEPVLAISPAFKLSYGDFKNHNLTGYTLRLYAYQESGSTITLVMDDLHLYPVGDGKFRQLGRADADLRIGFDSFEFSEDDSRTNRFYEYQGSPTYSSFFIQDKLGKLMVFPGINQKISWIFGMTTADTQTKINSAYLGVSMSYRPRRRTI